MFAIVTGLLKLIAQCFFGLCLSVAINIFSMFISSRVFDEEKELKRWMTLSGILNGIVTVAGLVSMLSGWVNFGGFTPVVCFSFLYNLIWEGIYFADTSEEGQTQNDNGMKEAETAAKFDSRSRNVISSAEKANSVFDKLLDIHVRGAKLPADEIFNHKTVCEIAESVKSIALRFSRIKDSLILSEDESKLLSKEGIRLHEEACDEFCKVCKDIQSFGEEIWPRIRMAAKQFELVSDAEQRDLQLLQQVQEYLNQWNKWLDEVSQLSVQIAETLLMSDKNDGENEYYVPETRDDLIHCRKLLVDIHTALKATPLHEDFSALMQVFCRIEPKDWNEEILSYSVMYLQLLRRAVSEYVRAIDKQDLESEICNGVAHLTKMWNKIAGDAQCMDTMKLKAELKAATNLGHVRGYVPGTLMRKEK